MLLGHRVQQTESRNQLGVNVMNGRELASIGISLGVLDVAIPYLLLKDVSAHWANFLFWSVLTLTVLILGIMKVRGWGGK